jgi:hypothetical protein
MKFINKKQRWIFSLYWLFFLIMGIALSWQHRERQRREAVAESLCATAELTQFMYRSWLTEDHLDHYQHYKPKSNLKEFSRLKNTLLEITHDITKINDELRGVKKLRETREANIKLKNYDLSRHVIEYKSLLTLAEQADSSLITHSNRLLFEPLELWDKCFESKYYQSGNKEVELLLGSLLVSTSLLLDYISKFYLEKSMCPEEDRPNRYAPWVKKIEGQKDNLHVGDSVRLAIDFQVYSDAKWSHVLYFSGKDTLHMSLSMTQDSFLVGSGKEHPWDYKIMVPYSFCGDQDYNFYDLSKIKPNEANYY